MRDGIIREAAELRRRGLAGTATLPRHPLDWAQQVATIVHPERGRIPFTPYPYQADFLEHYSESRRIILKARQIGYSQIFALEALYAAINEPNSTILLISRSQDLATNLLRYCYLTYNGLRDAPELVKENESEMGFTNGSRIKSIPANRSTGRGFTATRIYLDEFAYTEYGHDIYQSVSPAVSQGGILTIGSTPNGVGNLFHELYISGDGLYRQRVPWYDCPVYYTAEERAAGVPHEQAAWYLRERPKYSYREWMSEYECDFIGSGDAVFRSEDIDAAREGAVGEQERIEGHHYIHSVDIGRRQDPTVINTTDISVYPYQRVKHQRFERIPYPLIQSAIERTWNHYGGEMIVESNGVGDPVIENLEIPVTPFVTTSKSKIQAVQSMTLLLEHRAYKAQWTAQEKTELTLYRWDDKLLVQDCVISLAIGADKICSMGEPVPSTTMAKAARSSAAKWHPTYAPPLQGGRWGHADESKSYRRR